MFDSGSFSASSFDSRSWHFLVEYDQIESVFVFRSTQEARVIRVDASADVFNEYSPLFLVKQADAVLTIQRLGYLSVLLTTDQVACLDEPGQITVEQHPMGLRVTRVEELLTARTEVTELQPGNDNRSLWSTTP